MHERLRARLRQLGMNVATLARGAHVNRSFVYDILRGKSQVPNLKKLTRIAAVVKVDLEWLLSGKGRVDGDDPITEEYHNDFVAIQYAHARPSMGGGAIVEDKDRVGRDFHFRRAWIRERLKAAPSLLRVLTVQGDSMIPTLEDCGCPGRHDTAQPKPTRRFCFARRNGARSPAARVRPDERSTPRTHHIR